MRQLTYTFNIYKNSIFHSRILFFLIAMAIFVAKFNKPLLEFACDIYYPCTIWVFPFLVSSYTFLTLFYFGIIYAFSDIPFMQRSNMFSILRIGRKRWAFGELCNIFLISCTLVLSIFAFSMLTLVPNIEIQNDWGKLLYTAIYTNAADAYHFKFRFYNESLIEFSPLQLTLLSVSICILIVTLLGFAMFALSLYFNRAVSISLASASVVFLFFVNNTHPRIRMNISKFVPTIWAEVARVVSPEYGYYWLPAIPYMFIFLGISLFICAILIIHKIKNVEFSWDDDL